MKRLLPFLTALLMLLPLSACGKQNPPPAGTTGESGIPTEPGSGADDRENTPDALPSGLNFDGEEIGIFYGCFDTVFDTTLYEMEGQASGDQVPAAVWLRNDVVERRLNVNLTFRKTENTQTTKAYRQELEKLILNGETKYDIYYHRGATSLIQVNQGLFLPLDQLPYLDFDKPWWYTDQMREISLNENSNYVLMGEMLLSNYSNMTAVFFNADLYRQLFPEAERSLYDTVRANDWDWEYYAEMIRQAWKDEDGNGFPSAGDIFGAAYEVDSNRTCTYYPYTCGLRFSSRTSEGFPELDIYKPDTVGMVEKLYDLLYGNDGTFAMTFDEAKQSFLSGRLLFHPYFLSHGMLIQQNADFDYGVLPFPKYSKDTDYTTAILSGAGVLVIPKILPADHTEAVGAVLEALSAESYRNVSLKYYNTILKTRQAGGPEDAEMVDFIRDHLKFDLTFWVGGSIGNVTNIFKEVIITNHGKDLTSYWKQNGGTYEGALADLIDKYKKEFA